MRFTKMHGIGNDYVYVNCFAETISNPEQLAVQVSDRHFGIGSDGLILIMPSDKADVTMRMFNADGSESQMCGNGVRCVAKYSYDYGLVNPTPIDQAVIKQILSTAQPDADEYRQIKVQTGRGILTIGLAIKAGKVSQACVDMGEPILMPNDIPVKVTGRQVVGVPYKVDQQDFLMTCVSMGNPHAVFFVNNVEAIELERLGPMVENDKIFPERINAHFVKRVSDSEVIMRTWERGSGITLACGTGASAVCVAGVLASKTGRNVLMHLSGGDLQILWNEADNHVFLCGPAAEVYHGDWPTE